MKKLLFSFLIALIFVSCDSSQQNSDSDNKPDKLQVFAVNYPLAYFVQRIGGEHIDLIEPIPGDVDPAYWLPEQSLSSIQASDIIFANGADYAKWMAKVSLPASKVINTSEADTSKYIMTDEGMTHSHGGSGEHVHAEYAFTTWLDFEIAADQAEAIKNTLIKNRPDHTKAFTDNFNTLKAELLKLDLAMAEIGSALQGQNLFASHPVYQYLAQAYGITIISEHWEPGVMPTAEQWDSFDHNLHHNPATIMLWEGPPAEETVAALEELGVKSILFQPCGNNPGNGDFISIMKQNIDNLQKAL